MTYSTINTYFLKREIFLNNSEPPGVIGNLYFCKI